MYVVVVVNVVVNVVVIAPDPGWSEYSILLYTSKYIINRLLII